MSLHPLNLTTNQSHDCYFKFYQNSSVRWIFTILLSVLMFFTLVGNGLVCFALVMEKALRTPANIFLLNMSVGDVFVTGTIIFTDYAYLIDFPAWRLGAFGNRLYNIGFVALLILPFLTLIAVTVDRYLSILFPFKYIEMVTKKKAGFCVLLLWFYTVFAVSLVSTVGFRKTVSEHSWVFLLPRPWYLAILMFHTVIPLVIILGLYLKIYLVARRHHRRIGALTNRFGERGLNVRFMKSELKATRTVLIVVIALAISWLPFIVSESAVLVFPEIKDCTTQNFSAVTTYVTYINGAINPVVYSLRHRRFLLVFQKVFCCKNGAVSSTNTRNVGASVLSV